MIVIPISIISIIILENNYQNKEENLEKNYTIEESFTQQMSVESNQNLTQNDINSSISERYSQIESNRLEYYPEERVWQSSGPFKIDRYQYVLGEKIFLITNGLKYDENGEIVIYRPLNSTHHVIWQKYSFDGSIKNSFNIYFDPKINKDYKICDKNDLIGEWIVIFSNVNYPNMYFSINNQTLPGEEDKFNKVEC